MKAVVLVIIIFWLFNKCAADKKYCWYFEGGYPIYFICRSYEDCCDTECCVRALSIQKIWYFWLLLLLAILFCCGVGYFSLLQPAAPLLRAGSEGLTEEIGLHGGSMHSLMGQAVESSSRGVVGRLFIWFCLVGKALTNDPEASNSVLLIFYKFQNTVIKLVLFTCSLNLTWKDMAFLGEHYLS
ncbi:uncharacterized protein LOC134072684 isoform X1 [Sardina pilchardus]|uniref:uncharacterized protein LOC134072684 isoform X1 n=1 Tax=Sardina pilchardus TaxID=27697 RepID=UPI002E101607